MDQSLKNFKINYKILQVHEKEQSIVVRYWTDFLTENDLAVDNEKNSDGSPVRCRCDYNLNVWDYIKTEEDLNKMIQNAAPIDWFKLQYRVKNPEIDNTINGTMSIVKGLLNKVHVKEIENIQTQKNIDELTDDEVNQLIDQLTKNQAT